MMKKLKILNLGLLFCILIFGLCLYAFAQEKPTSTDLMIKSWGVHGKKEIENTFKYTQQCIDLYKEEADLQQASLTEIPQDSDIAAFSSLNNVATCYFIQAESYMRQGKNDEAKEIFNLIIDKYPYAQAWDPRGWYWVIADAARQSIKKIETGSIEIEKEEVVVSQIPTKIVLYDPGTEEVVDYEKYGEFQNPGTKDYKYVIKDQEGLIQAVGEGIYPNTSSLRWDPEFKKALKEKRLEGDQWAFVHSPDLQAAFFKWATSSEPMGVKLFYSALMLEKSGLIKQAIKCYYAIIVHYPGSYGWTYFKTPWYIAQASIPKIKFLLRRHPEIGYKLVDSRIRIINGYDNDVSNDTVIANPGRLVKLSALDKIKDKIKTRCQKDNIVKKSGDGKVRVIQYDDGKWELLLNDQPYIIKGITYEPTKVGQSPDEGTLGNWMEEDFNNNGKPDGPFDSFVDKNRNGIQDEDEPAVGDFQLMKEMGVNTIRLYHHPRSVDKSILRYLYDNYGIRVIMGDFLGKYALGSGATWYEGTDYSNPEHQKNMLESVRKMVEEFKDEPYILLWLLGNENVYGVACNANKDPESFFKFVNQAVKLIKSIDKDHPVAICSGDILYLDKFGKYANEVDIFAANSYRGDYGFGYFWEAVRLETDKPAFITEFGCSGFLKKKSQEEAELAQAEYHRGCWEDIMINSEINTGAGNAIGGIIFEWLDEWWKGYEPAIHDKKGLWKGPFPDGTMYEEWLGLCGQGDGKLSPFLRELRKAYFLYKEIWREKGGT
jgi:hypothetical protein